MDKVLFFGYGANRNRTKIKQIIEHDPGEGVGAILEGYVLATQTIHQIPEPTKGILADLFGNDFKAYTLRKGEGSVQGIIWEIKKDDLEKIQAWEFVGSWRELIEVEVISSGNVTVKAYTEKSPEDQEMTNIVDGLVYDEFNITKKEVTVNQEQDEYYTQQQIEKIRALLKKQS